MDREVYNYADFDGCNFQFAELKAMFDTLESNTVKALEPAGQIIILLEEIKTRIANLETRMDGIEGRQTEREIKYAATDALVAAVVADSAIKEVAQ